MILKLALAACVAASACAQAADTYTFPTYANGAAVDADCQRMLADLKQQEATLGAMQAEPAAALLAGFDAVTRRVEDTLGPLALLAAVHPAKDIRDAAEACDLAYQAFNTAFFQNARLHALLQHAQAADAIDSSFARDLREAFEDAGVALAAQDQARVQALTNEITALGQAFDRRIREDRTTVAFTAAELKGVPAAVWKRAPRDAQGRYLLGLDYPSSVPVIERATSTKARERMWRAVYSRGGEENLQTLAQLGQLRRELARLFGLESYADFALRRRMAKSAATVQAFLDTVRDAVRERELADVATLREAKARHLGTALEATVLERWDTAFYTERVRQARFRVDQERFRAYLPPEASLNFVFLLAQRLFGATLAPLSQQLWHADARAFEVRDQAGGRTLGTLFVDLYPRADKYTHAAVWPFRNVSTRTSRLPAAALVVNFNRKGLSLDELETLLHEFGHAIHVLLSQTHYASQGGISVKLDFAEAPSQMLEDWVYDAGVLKLFGTVCASCKPVPTALLAQADKARHFAKGMLFARQHLYASYDLALYAKDAPEPMALWARMEAATPLGHVSGSRFPASFGHVATNYAAGYYSYLWSLVLAEDLRTAFAADKLDADVGSRYRRIILGNGGQVAAADLMQQFLGRASDSKAFFKSLNKQ